MIAQPDTASSRPKVVISKETTFVTEPLGPDGMVDFVAALNASLSKGVTPENNAAVAFWKAVGTKRIDPKIRPQYLALLGLPDLPQETDSWVTFDEFLRLQNHGEELTTEAQAEADRHFDEAWQKPWTRAEHPSVAAMLDRNAKSLELLREGMLRPRYFSPHVADEYGTLLLLNGISESRDVAKQFAARAMLRLGEGDVDKAWQDTLVIYRYARLFGQRPFLVDRLVAITIEGMAHVSTVRYSQQANLTAAQARQFRRQLQELPAMPLMQDTINGERVFSLCSLWELATRQEQSMSLKPMSLMEDQLPAEVLQDIRNDREVMKNLVITKDLDWTEAFRLTNQLFDRSVQAVGECETSFSPEAVRRFETEPGATTRSAPAMTLAGALEAIRQLSPQAKAQRLIKMVHGSAFGVHLPPCLLFVIRTEIQQDLAQLAFALAGYRYDRHYYPKTLGELTPDYIDALPKDRWGIGDLKYVSDGENYLLYSVGPNGKDDGGHNRFVDWQTMDDEDSAGEEDNAADNIADLHAMANSVREEDPTDDIAIRTGMWRLKK